MEAGAVIEELARDRLGFDRLRPGQLDAVEALAGGRDVLAVLPTGGGKSAIYELAGHPFNVNSPQQLGKVLFEGGEAATHRNAFRRR